MDTDTSADEIKLKRSPIQQYINRKIRFDREANYIKNIESILREYEGFLYNRFEEHICNVDDSHVVSFNNHLKSGDTYLTLKQLNSKEPKEIDLNDRTRHDYLRTLVSFYNWLVEDEEVLSRNPAKKALNDLSDNEFNLAPPGRPRIEMVEMRDFLQWLKTPLQRAFILFLLKTGTRLGETVNVDLSCLNIDHPLYEHLLKEREITLVSEIQGHPDTVYIDPGFKSDTEIRGEIRSEGNKRERDSGTVIPIDTELKTSLLEYLLTRREAYNHPIQARPLFLNRQESGENDRLTQQTVYQLLTKNGDSHGVLYDYGWWDQGRSTDEKVTPHYFRHFFTHNHRHNQGVHRGHMPEGVIAYIRGDVPDSTSAREKNYRHDDWNTWERYIKKPYLNGIYQFKIYK